MRPPAARDPPPRHLASICRWTQEEDTCALSATRASNLGGPKREGMGEEGEKRKKGENVRPLEDGREKGEMECRRRRDRDSRSKEGTWKNASLRINGGVATTMHSPDIQASGQLVRYSTDRISGQIIRFSFFVAVSLPPRVCLLPIFCLFRLDLFLFTFSPSIYLSTLLSFLRAIRCIDISGVIMDTRRSNWHNYGHGGRARRT